MNNIEVDTKKWISEGQCTCRGILTVKYKHISDDNTKLRIKPSKKRFNLYSRNWTEWDKPVSELNDLLTKYNL
jgi:hypothetical protein